MTDVIIAVIPAPGHEGLVEAGERIPNHPAVRVERPMIILRCMCGAYVCKSHYLDGHGYDLGKKGRPLGEALVLHAPGGPRLGMVRAREATYDGRSAAVGEEIRTLRGGAGPIGQALHLGKPYFSWPLPEAPEWLGAPCPVLGDYPHPGRFAFALAHLLRQRGLASEVLVLPVPA